MPRDDQQYEARWMLFQKSEEFEGEIVAAFNDQDSSLGKDISMAQFILKDKDIHVQVSDSVKFSR